MPTASLPDVQTYCPVRGGLGSRLSRTDTSWACCTSEMDGQGSWPFTSVTDANTFTTKYYPSRNLRNLTSFYKQQVELWYLGTTSVNSLRNITFLETNPGQLDMANLKVTLTCLDSPK